MQCITGETTQCNRRFTFPDQPPTLVDVIDDKGFATLLDAARDRLADLADGTGVAFDVSALVLSGPPTD